MKIAAYNDGLCLLAIFNRLNLNYKNIETVELSEYDRPISMVEHTGSALHVDYLITNSSACYIISPAERKLLERYITNDKSSSQKRIRRLINKSKANVSKLHR